MTRNWSFATQTSCGGHSVIDALAERRAEQQRLTGLAREFIECASRRLPIAAAAVVGSVARGDFNVWSDVDVLVMAEALPEGALERQNLFIDCIPPGVQPVALTPKEFRAAVAKGNRLAREALDAGVVLAGDAFFAAERSAAGSPRRTRSPAD